MPSLGPAEILVILVIALLVFGPDKMPEIARQAGRGFREFKRMQTHLKAELRDVVSEFDKTDDEHGTPTGTPAPAVAGDAVPSLPPLESSAASSDLATGETAGEATGEGPAAALPPSEVALPPAEVALPPAEPPAEHA